MKLSELQQTIILDHVVEQYPDILLERVSDAVWDIRNKVACTHEYTPEEAEADVRLLVGLSILSKNAVRKKIGLVSDDNRTNKALNTIFTGAGQPGSKGDNFIRNLSTQSEPLVRRYIEKFTQLKKLKNDERDAIISTLTKLHAVYDIAHSQVKRAVR